MVIGILTFAKKGQSSEVTKFVLAISQAFSEAESKFRCPEKVLPLSVRFVNDKSEFDFLTLKKMPKLQKCHILVSLPNIHARFELWITV